MAFNRLLHEKLFEAAAPLERSIYELWVEFRYLLRFGSRVNNARKLLISANIELTQFAFAQRDQFGKEAVAGCVQSLRSYKRDYPELYAQIQVQRRQRRFHWSGLTRAKLEQELAPGSIVYKGLSWEAHATLTATRDFQLISRGSDTWTLEFGPLGDLVELASWQAHSVAGMLWHIWNEYAGIFGLDAIEG